jgi:hypothetical protein
MIIVKVWVYPVQTPPHEIRQFRPAGYPYIEAVGGKLARFDKGVIALIYQTLPNLGNKGIMGFKSTLET